VSRRKRYDVCAAVVSDLRYDARVWKEARSLAAAGYSVALLGCAYELDGITSRREHGVDVTEIPLGRQPVEKLVTLARLWVAILRTPARVYHAHNIHTGIPAWVASRLRRAALVYDAHELYGEPLGPGPGPRAFARASAAFERFMVRASSAVITTNPSRARVLEQRHGRQGVQVLQNVPPRVEELDPLDPGYPAGRSVLLYQGGIYAHSRAFRETVQAIALLDDVHFVLIGFGRPGDLEAVRGWAAEAGVADRVHLLPARPFDELVRTAAAATVGLVPVKGDNLNNKLGDTNKLFEYLMAGLPVVASDLPEIKRVAGDGDPPVGEVFDPGSAESIAAAIRRVLGDGDGYEARRREARRLALDRYNWEIEERRLLDVYKSVTGNARGRATEEV
jgi:glycosyltransferase involved in cell wall biosynthesis